MGVWESLRVEKEPLGATPAPEPYIWHSWNRRWRFSPTTLFPATLPFRPSFSFSSPVQVGLPRAPTPPQAARGLRLAQGARVPGPVGTRRSRTALNKIGLDVPANVLRVRNICFLPLGTSALVAKRALTPHVRPGDTDFSHGHFAVFLLCGEALVAPLPDSGESTCRGGAESRRSRRGAVL